MSSKSESVVLDISVQPRSSKSVIMLKDEIIKVYLKSPPVDGKANEECMALFSKALHISKSSVSIDKGEHGKRKRLRVSGLSLEDIMKILSEGVR